MKGQSSERREGRGQSSGGVGMAFVGLFPTSDSDDEHSYGGSTAATPAAKKRGEAQQDWSIFPDKKEALAQPSTASAKVGRRSSKSEASGVAGLTTAGATPAGERVAGVNGEQNPGRGKKKTKKKVSIAVVKEEERKAVPSPLHASVEKDEEHDLEAAYGTRPPSPSRMAEERAIEEFEVGQKVDRKHALSGFFMNVSYVN